MKEAPECVIILSLSRCDNQNLKVLKQNCLLRFESILLLRSFVVLAEIHCLNIQKTNGTYPERNIVVYEEAIYVFGY